MGAWCSKNARKRTDSSSPFDLSQDIRLDDFLTNELEPICPSVKVHVRMSRWNFQIRLPRRDTVSDQCIQKLIVVTTTVDQHEIVSACLLANEFPKGKSKHNSGVVDIRWLDATGYADDPYINMDSALLNAYLVYAKLLGYERAYFCVHEVEQSPEYIFRDCPIKHEPAHIRMLRYEKEVFQSKTDQWQFTKLSTTSPDAPVLPNPALMQALHGSGVAYSGGEIPHPSLVSRSPVFLINLANASVHVLGLFRETGPVSENPADLAQICYYPRGFGSFAAEADAAVATRMFLTRCFRTDH